MVDGSSPSSSLVNCSSVGRALKFLFSLVLTMNIFYLDKDPKLAAQYHCDKHVVKMILESAQLLSTAHRVLDGELGYYISLGNRKIKQWTLTDWRESKMYKTAHYNHPCAVWVRQSSENYKWLYQLFKELCYEYFNRYDKTHMCETKLMHILSYLPDKIPKGPFTEPVQVMDLYPQCKVPGDSVQAYRNYYKEIKSEIAEWNHSEKPFWF